MAKLTFDTDQCKGCGLCVEACPRHVITIDTTTINHKGHTPATAQDGSLCIGCGFCAVMCPDCVITVER